MKSNSLLTVGIILICFFYLSADIFTLLSYSQMFRTDEASDMFFGPSRLVVYTFSLLFLLKILLVFKARVVADYLLPKEEVILPGLDMNNVLLVTGIILVIVSLPDLIMAIATYKKSVEYVDDQFKAFNAKLGIYESGLELLFAGALIYWRRDILDKLANTSE